MENQNIWYLRGLIALKTFGLVVAATVVVVGVFSLGYMCALHNIHVSAVQAGHGHWSVVDDFGNTEFVWGK